ncbi:MAG: TonB-dependent receptor, partial [Leptospiraceae bacterium]|nr:TonB-dependent receptor [Leptospiraceae bacterium]
GLAISVYYTRNRLGNLELYAQAYNIETGYVIDAVSIRDDMIIFSELKLEPEEFRIEDSKRVELFMKRLEMLVRLNSSGKERPENLNRELIDTPLSQAVNFPIHILDDKEEAKSAFQLIEDQQVVTATRTKTSVREAPAAVYVVSARDIRLRGYRTLSDVLHDLPGFDFQHTYGVYPDLIHQRGLIGTMQRTLLYIDGIPDNNIFENAMLGGTVRFPLNNVKRIEVVSGPASAIYGANAFNGIINIITKDGESEPGSHVDVSYGTWEKHFTNPGYSFSLSTRGKSGEIQYSVGAYYYQTAGPNFAGIQKLDKPNYGATDENPFYNYNYDPFYYYEKKACGGSICNPGESAVGYYSSPAYNNSREDTYNITAKFQKGGLRFETVNWQYLQAEGLFGNGTQWIDTKQRGLETNKFDTRNNLRRLGILLGYLKSGEKGFSGSNWDVKNNSILMGYLHNITDSLNIDTEVIVRQTDIINSSQDSYPRTLGPGAYYQPGDVDIADTYDRPDYAYQLEERLQWNPSSKLSTITGVVAKHFVAARDYGSFERYRYNNFAVYLQQQYKPVEKLSLMAGYRHDYTSSYGSANTPRLSAIYFWNKDLSFKFLLGTAFREPSGEELYSLTPQRKPNESLRPELLRSYELGFAYRFLKRYFVSAQSYYNSISNLILEVQTQDRAEIQGKFPNGDNPWNQYQNIGKAKIFGLELEGKLSITDSLSLDSNYTYNYGYYYDLPSSLQKSPSTVGRKGDNLKDDIYLATYKAITGNDSVISKGEIPNIAPNKFFLGFSYFIRKNVSVYMGMNFVDARKTIATNPEKKVAPYKFIKFNFRWEDFLYEGMYVQVHINNLWNEQFFDPGIRVADGNFYPSLHPLERRNIWLTLGYKF